MFVYIFLLQSVGNFLKLLRNILFYRMVWSVARVHKWIEKMEVDELNKCLAKIVRFREENRRQLL